MAKFEVRCIWRREETYIVEAANGGAAANRWRDGELIHTEVEQLVGQEIALVRKASQSTIGERVRHLRERRGMTQVDLAEAAGISGSYLSHLEAGRRLAGVRILSRLASALGVDREDLEPRRDDDPVHG